MCVRIRLLVSIPGRAAIMTAEKSSRRRISRQVFIEYRWEKLVVPGVIVRTMIHRYGFVVWFDKLVVYRALLTFPAAGAF